MVSWKEFWEGSMFCEVFTDQSTMAPKYSVFIELQAQLVLQIGSSILCDCIDFWCERTLLDILLLHDLCLTYFV